MYSHPTHLFFVLIGFLICSILIAPVAATGAVNVTRVHTVNTDTATPFVVWAGAIVLGLALIIVSFIHFPAGEEGLISILAWIPIGYAMYASFAVEFVTGGGGISTSTAYTAVESYNVHSFTTIAVMLFILLMFAIGNTYRIFTNMRKVQSDAAVEPTWHERNQPARYEE